jgi:hypothetical protein
METTVPPDLATGSSHRLVADSFGTLLPPVRVGGATTNRPANIRRQFASFATIGLPSTIAYLVLYSGFRAVLGRTLSNALGALATALRFVLLRSWIGTRAALAASETR